MRRLGKLLDETKPDALIIFGSDHMETFFLKSVPTFAIMSCENATAAFAGRSWNLPIEQGLAEAILDQLVARHFDMAYSQEASFVESQLL
jgi:2,3-dihydroxyphenylpropionate 1,2-dioxygenase